MTSYTFGGYTNTTSVPTFYASTGGYTTATNYILNGGTTNGGTITTITDGTTTWRRDAAFGNAGGWSVIKDFVFDPPEADICHRNDVSEDEIDQSEELCGFLEEISE